MSIASTDKGYKNARWFIGIVSVLIPAAVAAMYLLPAVENIPPNIRGILNQLPTFNACINGLTFFFLIGALIAIRKKKVKLHRNLMTMAVTCAALFLVSYVIFHSTTEGTKFQGTGGIRTFYFTILLSHIVLSAAIVPLVLITYVRGLAEKFDKHRKIAKFTWPIWVYVTVSGVMVYLMIRPYYPF